MNQYSFYYVKGKYPKFLGHAYGETKQKAFESLRMIKGYSNTLKLGKIVKGYKVLPE
jgi:hypothetical protein